MNHSPDYGAATNAAYQLIADKDTFSLSTDVFEIAARIPNCKIMTYSQACAIYRLPKDILLSVSELGFTMIRSRETCSRIILYNEEKPLCCIRFTIAHKIGHAILRHTIEDESWEEKEANCFARNLLCPVPVIDNMQVSSTDEYVSAFNVSRQMACIARSWNESDEHYIHSDLYNIVREKATAYMCGVVSLNEFHEYYEIA